MKTLFYFLTIFPLMFEMLVIADTKKYRNFVENIKKKESLDMTNKKKTMSYYRFYILFGI